METNVGKKLIPSLCESTKCTGLRLPFNLPLRDRESCESCKKITSLVEEQLKYFDWIVSKILKDVSSICREFYDEATFKRVREVLQQIIATISNVLLALTVTNRKRERIIPEINIDEMFKHFPSLLVYYLIYMRCK